METAKKLIDDNKAAEAVKLLKYVVKYYPTTKGAAEAKELLEKMK
jgi:TolA-binding protein